MEKRIINTPDAPEPIGPYNQAILAGNMLFISGQVAINPKNNMVEARDIFEEAHQVMHNLRAVLHAAGLDFKNVVKTTIFLTDMAFFYIGE
ncbi:MAG: Rid family detoxifying hydrolase [Puia sp.]